MRIPYKTTTQSAEQTMEVGKEIAALVDAEKADSARVILLRGDLGAGKTTLVKGFLSYFDIVPHQASPTFVIARRYRVDTKTTGSIIHIDAYRLTSKKDWEDIDLHKEEMDSRAILLVEWPDNIKGKEWSNALAVWCDHGDDPNQRAIRIDRQ